jgi:glycosyltransferase involved in cell wall biosynthesis
MLAKFPLHQIPYGLDTRIYQPLDQKECRTKLGIPLDKTVLMAAAVSFSDPRKGADLLIKALSQLSPALRAETVLLTIGNQTDRVGQTLGLSTISLGYLEDDHSKALAYSAADLFLFPSRAETFGIVAQESMACGTPIVAFDVGGVSDVVRPGITGLLAQPEDVEAFTAQMTYLMENRHLRQSLAMKCREVAVSEYSLGQYARHHKTLYEAMLSGERCIEF